MNDILNFLKAFIGYFNWFDLIFIAGIFVLIINNLGMIKKIWILEFENKLLKKGKKNI